MSGTELLAIVGAVAGGCLLAWFEIGRDRDFLGAAVILIGALIVGGIVSVVIA
jgi:hypothetical protein